MSQTEAEIIDEKVLGMTKDGLENLLANLGTETDKRAHSTFVNNKRLSQDGAQDELNAMYRTDWVSGKIVDIIPDDMTREWRSFNHDDLTSEMREKLEAEEERLNLKAAFNEAHKWARLYGTAFIIIAVDDGKDPREELDIDSIKPGSLRHIAVVDRHRVQRGDQVQHNPLKENYGYPTEYRFNETSVVVHHSRVIRFDGIKLPFDEFRRNGYWADSVLDRIYDAVTNFNTCTNSAASMVYEAVVDVVKIRGLMGYLESEEGEKLLRKRFSLASALKSFNNMLLLDSEEDFQNKTNTFSGLPDLIRTFNQILSGASDIPATRLFGDSPKGLNSTGEGEQKNYYDKIRADQVNIYGPKLSKFDKIMAKNIGIEDETILTYEFNSLFQLTEQQESEMSNRDAARDQVYLDQGVIKPSMVAKQLKDKGTYQNITDKYIEELEEEEENAGLSGAFNSDPESELNSEQESSEEEQEEETSTSEESEEERSTIPESSSDPNEQY